MGNTTSSSNIHNLLIVCITLALLMSIIFNIYAFCMKTHRDIGQRCYNFSTCRDTLQTTQQDGETEEQIKVGEDVQYAAVNFSREKTKRKTTETENKEILYSSVANFGLE